LREKSETKLTFDDFNAIPSEPYTFRYQSNFNLDEGLRSIHVIVSTHRIGQMELHSCPDWARGSCPAWMGQGQARHEDNWVVNLSAQAQCRILFSLSIYYISVPAPHALGRPEPITS